MHFTQAIAAAILAFSATGVLAAPVGLDARQLAGEGSAANSILSDTDNGVGYGVENAEDNVAKTISSVKGTSGGSAPPPPPPSRRQLAARQLAGEGSAADSILTDTDSGIGYGVENAEDNTAKLLGGTTSSGGSGSPPPPPPPGKARRAPQLDKISNGLGAIGNAAGVGSVSSPVAAAGDTIDGDATSAAANAGASIGSTEESTLENAGSSVPKARRQLDKISNGLGAVGSAAGVGAVSSPVAAAGDTIDGDATSAAANAGASVGSTEESTLENAGSSVPKKFRA